ncbi:MAG TPA: hypothetical protein VFU98_12160 [Microlunatus sp.]|nr:hypothetical protein [Microlunatus sp.]
MTEAQRIARRTLMIGSAATAAAMAAGLEALPAEAAVNPRRRTSFAVWDPITDRSTTAMSPRRVTIHIAVTRSTDIYGPNKGADGSYAHFYNPRSGAPRQHQTMDRRAAADLNGSNASISVEHAGLVGDAMTNSQLTNIAKIFAWAVIHCGVPNRIATVDDLSGLAWHRLGIDGNFGTYNRNDRKTWCRKQTGAVWSSRQGKTCPTNKFINQIPTVYGRAQDWLRTWGGHPG